MDDDNGDGSKSQVSPRSIGLLLAWPKVQPKQPQPPQTLRGTEHNHCGAHPLHIREHMEYAVLQIPGPAIRGLFFHPTISLTLTAAVVVEKNGV